MSEKKDIIACSCAQEIQKKINLTKLVILCGNGSFESAAQNVRVLQKLKGIKKVLLLKQPQVCKKAQLVPFPLTFFYCNTFCGFSTDQLTQS